jgi:hypothetical protein
MTSGFSQLDSMAVVNASAIYDDSPEYLRQVKRVDDARSYSMIVRPQHSGLKYHRMKARRRIHCKH